MNQRRPNEDTEDIIRLYENSPVPMGICSLEGNDIRHLSANKAAARLFRKRPHKVERVLASDLGIPQDRIEKLREYFEISQETKDPVSFEYVHDKDGRRLVVSAVVNYLGKDKDQRSQFSYSLLNVITESKWSLKPHFLDREHTLAVMIENSPAAVALKDLSGHYILANKNFDRYLGISSHDMIGKTDFDIFPIQVAEDVSSHDKEVLRKHEKIYFEEVYPHADGSKKIFGSHKFPINDSKGIPNYICSISIDITEARQAEGALRESEERLRVVLDNMSEGIMLFDSEKKLIYQNPASLRIHGYLSQNDWELKGGSSMSNWLFWDMRDRPLRFDDLPISRVFRNEIFQNMEIRIRRVDTGEVFYVSSNGRPVYDTRGNIRLGLVTLRDITEAKLAQKAQMESEERLRLALTAAKIGVFERDIETGKLMWSEEARSILGHEGKLFEEDFDSFFARIDPEHKEMFRLNAIEGSKRGESFNISYKFHRHDGKVLWINSFGKPVRDYLGKPRKVLGVFQDITEKKEIEEALKEREQDLTTEKAKLQSLLLQAPAIFSVTVGPDHVFEIFNMAARRNLGRDCTGMPIRKALPELEGKGFFEALDHVFKTGEPIILKENRADLIMPDGSVKTQYFNVVYHPWRDPKGNIVGIMNVTLDVTELVLARKRIEETEAELRVLANTISQLVWVTQLDGTISWFNDNWYSYTGSTPKDMENDGWKNYHDPEVLPTVLERWSTSMATGEPFEMEFPLRGSDGNYRWFLTRITPLKDRTGKIIKWFGTSTDIDKQRRYREELQEAIRARDEFISLASHELKTPLTSLVLQIQMLQRSSEHQGLAGIDLQKLNKFLSLMNLQTARLSRLVDDMLDIARIRAGKLKINILESDLCEFTTSILERMRPLLIEAGTVPELICTPPIIAKIDKFRMEQALTNLLTNAMRYGEHRPITISLEKGDRMVRVVVRDQGIGIEKDSLLRIFERFERAVSANEISGLGLGLYITQKIIEAHGGKIWAESEGIGKGTAFIIELPEASRSAGE